MRMSVSMNATYYCQVARLSGLLVRWQMRNCISGHSGIRQGSEPISCIVVVVIVVVVVGSWVDMLGVSLMNSFTTNVETDRQAASLAKTLGIRLVCICHCINLALSSYKVDIKIDTGSIGVS